jgi:hypothetical protein
LSNTGRVGEAVMWARLQVPLLALSAACLAVPDARDANSFELQLRPDSITDGVPQGFTFSLVNTSGHDVRVPKPAIECEDSFDGALWLRLDFTAFGDAEIYGVRGCASDTMATPPILDRAKTWTLLHAGQKLSWSATRERLDYDSRQPGIYEFWAEYSPPAIDPADREKLRAAGIDYPQAKLASGHIAFRKER